MVNFAEAGLNYFFPIGIEVPRPFLLARLNPYTTFWVTNAVVLNNPASARLIQYRGDEVRYNDFSLTKPDPSANFPYGFSVDPA